MTSIFCPTDTTQSSYVSLVCSSYRQRYSKEHEDFNLFDVRLQTFVFYPKSSISSRDMASAGFCYASEDRVLKCCRCKSTITRFREGDDPFVTGHHSGCPFVALGVTKKMEKTSCSSSSSWAQLVTSRWVILWARPQARARAMGWFSLPPMRSLHVGQDIKIIC